MILRNIKNNSESIINLVAQKTFKPTNSDTPAAKDIVCYFKLNKAITSGLNVNVYNEYFE